MIRSLNILSILFAAAVFALSGCEEKAAGLELTGLPAGDPCSVDDECTGPGEPQCVTEGIFPLAELADSDNDRLQLLDVANVGLSLPGGYCSTEPNCTDDDDCGAGGSCFFPLRDVTAEFFEGLVDILDLPEDEEAVMTTLIDFGQCLKACDNDSDCKRDGYLCGTPLADFLAMVDGADQSTFCIGEDDL
jgi:hypothetical protein